MSSSPEIVKKTNQLRKQIGIWRVAGERIALVPTMGALHEGHLSLVRLAKKQAKRVVVSVFVNPTQFAPGEDFESYPRDEENDRKKLAEHGVDLIYMPDGEAMYPPGFATHVSVSGLSEELCGRSRPHFFGGVATVVAKLLLRCLPDMAFFGEKDYQQLLVIRRMVRDLDIPVKILAGPTVREGDGLALSSRNQYLSDEERKKAPLLYAALTEIAQALARGDDADEMLQSGRARLAEAGFTLDYLEVRNADDLSPVTGKVAEPARVFAAAFLGETRLIDNVPVPETG